MSDISNCLDGLVGLTKNECDCFDTVLTESSSGLYVENLVELGDVFGLIDCANGSDVTDIMSNSLEQAKNEFVADFNASLLTGHKMKRRKFVGGIGKANYKNTLQVTAGKYVGVRMYCADVVSGYLRIKSIGGIFTQTGNIDLTIVNNLGEIVDTVTIATVANKHTITDVDIELPLHNDYVSNLEYFIYYTAGANLPKDNQIRCGVCGGFKQIYNTLRPMFASQTGSWQEWAMVGGMNYSDTVDFTDVETTASTYMHGLTLGVEFGCRGNDVICSNIANMEDKTPIGMAISHAINYKTGAIILNKIMKTDIINRATMLNRDEKAATITQYMERYNTMLQYIMDNIEFNQNDCFSCIEKWQMIKSTIRT